MKNEDLVGNFRFVPLIDERVRMFVEAFFVNELSKTVHLSDGSFPCFNQ